MTHDAMTILPAMPPPVLVLGAGILALLACLAWRRAAMGWVAAGTLVLALASLAFAGAGGPPVADGAALFAADGWFVYGAGLIVLSSGGVLAMAWRRLGDDGAGEGHLLLLLGTLGAVIVAGSANMIALFLGLETLSLSLPGLVAYRPGRPEAVEAAMKYLMLSGVSTAILLFGLALSYDQGGTLRFAALDGGAHGILGLAASIMVLTGLFFKLSVVPFHLWLPDVIEGAPLPVAAFIAVVSKIALFVALAHYAAGVDLAGAGPLSTELTAVAVLSMLGGNLLALRQTNLKRLLAGSSIAHIGYLLVALLSPGPFGAGSAAFYLAAYSAATLGAFAVLGAVGQGGEDMADLDSWRGMFHRHPAVACALSVMLLSLAGIPPVAGFFAKAYIVTAGMSAHRTVLLAALIVGSVIGLYYYLNVARVMMASAPGVLPREGAPAGRGQAGLVAVLAVVVVMIGLLPGPLVRWSGALVAAAGSHEFLFAAAHVPGTVPFR
ncbi:NADH dehydrogenase (quinone) [Gluconacetobacter diazotrophicus PA1 5]|uniref:NADH-quinone oxidoreductase subunit N n=2 Tax=Gluconacetobacter diazotrophicus TaxID=33996 RepID=A9HN70_GLUDA|nr:NADH dehydrogenase (quinone) [Gluconacetobacter diazotrophicus PA1 5]TWB02773.1 NADH dehydrogenase subunit N [Gluconacetobacter diazotrophicus]CAP56402.1 putative NADH-quinone oxidoreductase chain N [Gluconacetobacter diazotrophicus PA1 5]